MKPTFIGGTISRSVSEGEGETPKNGMQNNLLRTIMFAVGAIALSSCAKSPESIAPAYVSPLAYQNLECDQIANELRRVQSALAQVSQQQRDARSNDTVGVIFLGLPVSTLSGDNVAGQVAELKGEQRTLYQVSNEKRCDQNQRPVGGIAAD